jgi:hypothetical protein
MHLGVSVLEGLGFMCGGSCLCVCMFVCIIVCDRCAH